MKPSKKTEGYGSNASDERIFHRWPHKEIKWRTAEAYRIVGPRHVLDNAIGELVSQNMARAIITRVKRKFLENE